MKFLHPIVAAVALSIGVTMHAIEEFFAGFIYGFVEKDDLKEIELCFQDAGKVEGELEQLVYDLKVHDIEHLFDAAKVAANFVNDAQEDLLSCENMKSDFNKISDWLKTVKLRQIPLNIDR